MRHGTQTYAREENRAALGHDADQVLDLMRDQLANFTTRSALEAWLAHPRTARFLERLRFTPGAAELWTEMQERIAAARDWTTDDRPQPENTTP
jgi:hypothetical protein